MIETGRFVTSGLVGLVGLLGSVWLWRHSSPANRPTWGNPLLAGHRPWRRLGAAIVGFVSVIFFAGVNFIESSQHPRTFALFWGLVLLLVLWLCLLALVDTLHTLRLRSRLLRDMKKQLPDSPSDRKSA